MYKEKYIIQIIFHMSQKTIKKRKIDNKNFNNTLIINHNILS